MLECFGFMLFFFVFISKNIGVVIFIVDIFLFVWLGLRIDVYVLVMGDVCLLYGVVLVRILFMGLDGNIYVVV